jgi:hypothetical protein
VQVYDSMIGGGNICFIDPRLCNYETFLHYYDFIRKLLPNANIELVLYENSPAICKNNAVTRNDGRRLINETINHLSKIYDIDHYKKYNHSVMPCWKV